MELLLITFWLLSYFPKCDISQRLDNVRTQLITGKKWGKTKLSIRKEKTISLSSVSQIRGIVYVSLQPVKPGGYNSQENVDPSTGKITGRFHGQTFISTVPIKILLLATEEEDSSLCLLPSETKDKTNYAMVSNYQIPSTRWVKTGQVFSISKDPRCS